MGGWTANYVNNPKDDYNLVLEILYNDVDVALIYMSENGLNLKYYASEHDYIIPVDWLSGLLSDATKRLSNTK